jgi:hypothetical protein
VTRPASTQREVKRSETCVTAVVINRRERVRRFTPLQVARLAS